MDKKYQDIFVKIRNVVVFTMREIQLLSLIKEIQVIRITYITDKEYTILIPILPFMEIVIN